MVSDSDLATRLQEILKDSDLDTATAGSIRRQLENDFGVDLSDRKGFIRDQIDIYIETLQNNYNNNYYNNQEEPQINQEEDENEEENENDAVQHEDSEDDDEIERPKKVEKAVKKRGGGFTKLCSLSPQLQSFVGVPELARTEVVKKLWAYIREKDLQDPANKRNIKCDDALQAIFRVKSINMFQMNKALSKHIWPCSSIINQENDDENEEHNEEDNQNDAIQHDDSEDDGEIERPKQMEKAVKKRGGGFTKLCSLSPQLQNFVGVPELARTEVVKKLWAYIREKDLQDPANKRNIKCDDALQALFRVKSINMFQMNKALSKHIWPLAADHGLKVESECSNDSLPAQDNIKEDKGEQEEEDEEEEDEEEDIEKEDNKLKKKRRFTEADKDVKKRGGGFSKICNLSPQLQELVGVPQMARTEVVKKLWIYIREHNLQDPKDKRNIICDDSLRALFDVESINMFQMNKNLSKHIWPLNEEAAPDGSLQKERQCKHGREEGSDEPKQKEKQQKKGASNSMM